MRTTAMRLHIPGPRPVPVLGWRGNVVQFLRDQIHYLTHARRYGDLVGLADGFAGLVMTFNPAYTRQLLTDPDLFYSNPFVQSPPDTALRHLTVGLLSMNGPQHRQTRKLLMPAFHRKAVEAYAADMIALTEEMLGGWQLGQQFDLSRAMQHLTLRIASTALYGLPAGPTTARIGDMLRRWLALHEAPLTMLLPYDRPGTTYRRLLRASEQFEALFMELISWKRRNLDSQHDVLAMLLQAHDENGAPLSDAELVGQASILLNAGHETTSNALTWTLFLLAQHPHVLQDVRDEVQSVLHNSPPTLAQLAQLPLLERVIKESMRVLPPVCYSFRVSTAPFQMGPYEFGRGTGLFFSQYTTHHDPELYAEPQRFLPQRWETIDPSPYEYLPFGAGPRMCIGATFAMLEIKIVLSMIVQRFTLAVQPNARIDQQIKITLSPRHGMPVQVMPLDCVPAAARVRGNVREMVALP